MKASNIYELIFSSAIAGAELQASDGRMPPGSNGPYSDPETPVRNVGHWLIMFSRVYEWTGEERFRASALRCAEFLYSREARPHGFSFHHRNGRKDHCNGLVGQAWTFEALVEASALLCDSHYAHLAEEVFFQHPFNEELGLWKRLEIDGRVLSEDPTFNHQLWFAACASLLQTERRAEILRRVNIFLDRLDTNLTVLPEGLVYHPIEHLLEEQLTQQFKFGPQAKRAVRNWLHDLTRLRFPKAPATENELRRRTKENLIYKSIGYHAFNTYAFALLRQQIPNHSFWTTSRFRKMIVYLETDSYRAVLDDNKYGYPYNPPGFEVPFSLMVLKEMDQSELVVVTRWWVGEQFRRSFNPKTGKMEKNTEDPETHTARLYELTRMLREILEEVEIELP